MLLLGFFETCPDRIILVPLGPIGFYGMMVANKVMGFGELVACNGATRSGNLLVVDIILSSLNFWVNFSLVGIKCQQFLITTFPLLV